MFGNTFVLPHADGNVTAVKINQDGYSSEYLYRCATYEVQIRIRHSNVKATPQWVAHERHNVEVLWIVYASGEVAERRRKTYIVIEQEAADTDVKVTDAVADWLIATANANVVSLLAKES